MKDTWAYNPGRELWWPLARWMHTALKKPELHHLTHDIVFVYFNFEIPILFSLQYFMFIQAHFNIDTTIRDTPQVTKFTARIPTSYYYTITYNTILRYTTLYYTIRYTMYYITIYYILYTTLYTTYYMLYYTALYYNIIYYILYYTILYYILYYTIQHYTTLYYAHYTNPRHAAGREVHSEDSHMFWNCIA